MQKVLIDAWGWLTLYDASERQHQTVKALYSKLLNSSARIYTTDFILDETFTLFFKRLNSYQAQHAVQTLYTALGSPPLSLISIDSSLFAKTVDLRLKYADKPRISFTDLSTMVVMQELGIQTIITEDAHFLQVGLGLECLP